MSIENLTLCEYSDTSIWNLSCFPFSTAYFSEILRHLSFAKAVRLYCEHYFTYESILLSVF